jgi:hypothetical protein
MRTDTWRFKIDIEKKNAVIIGDSYELTDILEIFLYKKFNVITAIDEFDGMKKIEYFAPVCVFVKSASNVTPILAFVPKLNARHPQNIPVIVYSKEEYSTIDEFNLKAAGVKEIIKFPIAYKDFTTVTQPYIRS